ncbi:zinc finger protein 878-like [Sitodiplosis mosellana]|uniref:zinc finger protein 878-like n=1 Tax=Sitodiplosis mosellana TaxID=263140 RepID=UPI002444F3B2|nr:zinc finger protein 878-like [Sitodiplosis mosellana]
MKRYCGVKSCEHYYGTTRSDVRFFMLPRTDPELLAKWVKAVNIKGGTICRLCSNHFRDEDIRRTETKITLKKGTVPIPVPVPKTETLEEPSTQDPPTENIKIIDIAEIKRPSDQREFCQSCIDYEEQLQAAHVRIAQLEQKLSRLQLVIENRTVDNRIGQESPEDFTHLEVSRDDIKLEKQDSPIEHVELVSIDEIKSNNCSMLPASLLNVEMDESSSDEAPVGPVSGSSKEIEPDNELFGTKSVTDATLEADHSVLKPFQCGSCYMSFDLPWKLGSHIRKMHTTQFALPKKSRSTTRRKKEEKSFQCYLCQTSFSTMKEVRVHMERHKRDQKCKICRTALTVNELNSHLCGEERSIGCEYCSNEFTITAKLLEHLKTDHATKKMHKCEKCPTFLAMIALKEFHMKSHELDAPKRFICEICSKAFASKLRLRGHIERHDQIKSHLCDECGRSFASARNLELHNSSIHIGEKTKTLQCPECPKTFYQMKYLKLHSLTHREDKYVCEICEAELVSKKAHEQHLRKHKRTEADRKHACTLCPLKFFESTTLKSHQKVHTGVRSFSCKFCKANYKYLGDLNKHLKTHLGPKIHECPKCFELFEYKDLQKHEIEHYKEEKRAREMNE